MKYLLALLLMVGMGLQAQVSRMNEMPLPPGYRLKTATELPPRLNNADSKYFPEVISQHGWSCNQASSIGYVLTYELNALRDLDSKLWENHYAPLFPWNFLNRCNPGTGVSYFDTWEVVKAAGCPTYPDFPVYSDTHFWMSGYEHYLNAMKNRVVHNYSIHVGSEEGLLKLKNYLYDHANGSPVGGLANIQIASDNMTFRQAAEDSPDPLAPIIISFGQVVGHALTIVGYDDEIGYDVNRDGQITNDIDINEDGDIDLEDWEMGAVLIANTWGKGWARDGFTYVLYRVLAHDGHEGGIWNESVHVVQAVKEYDPKITLKVVMEHSARNRFSLLAGYSKDLTAEAPDQVMGFPHFNYQGDETPLYSETPGDTTRFELGLDISPLLSGINPDEAVKIFFLVDEKDPTDIGQGKIRSVTLYQYEGDTISVTADATDVAIKNDAVTSVSMISQGIQYEQVAVQAQGAQSVAVGEVLNLQLQASGGTEPYIWELVRDFSENHFERDFPNVNNMEVLMAKTSNEQFFWVDLPFLFPFYDDEYLAIIADRHGALHFNAESLDYPYAINTDLRFRVRKSLIPFGRELSYVAPDDGIWYSLSDTCVTFVFNATVKYLSENYNIEFACNLYPDGRIEFHYGDFDQPPGSMYDWLTGISNGDAENYKYASINELGVLFPNYGVCFEPSDYPGEVSLSSSGLLTCRPDAPNQIWNVYVQVRDRNNLKKTAAIPISTVVWDETEMLSSAYPNPFIGVTTISFKVASEQAVKLSIYDLAGRKVKTLVDENLLAGEYQYYWNGTNYANRDVVPGLYFYRLEVAEGFETQKIVKVE